MHNHDRALGPQDVGGLVYATVQCPIFDPRPAGGFFSRFKGGNFQWTDITTEGLNEEDRELNNKRIMDSRRPLESFDPFGTKGYVRVVNPLALHYYEISENYRCDAQGFKGLNWISLLDIGRSILTSEQSIGSFIERVTVRVRLAASAEMGWTKDAQKYVMQVSTPAFGQVIQDESIGYPIHPMAHTQKSRKILSDVFDEIDGRARSFDRRVINDATR